MPVVSGNVAIFGGCDGILHVIDIANGKKHSQIEIGDYIAGTATVDGDRAYLGHYGNAVICVDIKSGKIIWTFRDKGFPYFASPAIDQGFVVIGGRDRQVHCLEQATGKRKWVYKTRGKVDASATLCDNKVVVGSEDGTLLILDFATGKLIWKYTIGRAVMCSPLIHDGRIYVGSDDGYLYAFEPA
jgi:outer membrane protein assembly factor BamB